MLIVGRKAYDANFAALTKSLSLDRAVRSGLRVLVFEQTTAAPLGLKLEETSARDAFPTSPGQRLLAGLEPADLRDLRGQSDLIEPYPEAPEWSKDRWPPRCWKWGNRGILATYVYRKPHYSPFVPALSCGFDLAQSPLLQARLVKGSVTLCQVDVTPRYAADPVPTRPVDNMLRELSRPGEAQLRCSYVGASAREFVKRFGLAPERFTPDSSGIVLVGAEPVDAATASTIERAAQRGATVVLLPGAVLPGAFGLKLQDARLFIGRMTGSPLLAGMNDGDLYLKAWQTLPTVTSADGWTTLVDPGLLATKQAGAGRIVACTLDPDKLGKTRGRVKALRFWDILLANLGAECTVSLTAPAPPAYEDNEWEQIPPCMGW